MLTLSNCLAVMLWVACALPTTLPAAATNYVTTTNDSGPGSLRQVIANSSPGDLIRFRTNGVITLTNGELFVTNSIRINGPGATNLAISGNNNSRVFNFSAGITSSISGLTLRDGRTENGMNGTMISGNAGNGGGLYNSGTLTVSRCIFVANQTGMGGGRLLGVDGTQPGDSGGPVATAGTVDRAVASTTKGS